MAGRISPVVLGVLGMLTGVALTGVVMTVGAARANADTRTTPPTALTTAAPTAGSEGFGAPTHAPAGERLLDTTAATAAPKAAPQPIPFAKNTVKGKRGMSDEHLPSWVPLRGRLTVVQSHDLAENLGLVPAGTTKKAEGRIVVADMLAQNPTASTTTSSPQSAPWLASNGRFRHSRSR
jgi:hypothetical protein